MFIDVGVHGPGSQKYAAHHKSGRETTAVVRRSVSSF